MAGLNEAKTKIARKELEGDAVVRELDLNQMSMNSMALYGNGEIGMIANWQAVLNHSGALTPDLYFNVSDVVDAVNYKSGDVQPVLLGLKDAVIQCIIDQKINNSDHKLARGAALQRIFRQLQKEWKIRGHEQEHGPLRLDDISKEYDWTRRNNQALLETDLFLQEELTMRKLMANGVPNALVYDHLVPDWAFELVLEWNDLRSGTWAEFLSRRQSQETMNADLSFQEKRTMQERFSLEAQEISDRINMDFIYRIMYNKNSLDNPGATSLAYLMIEAVRDSRWISSRPMNFGPLIKMTEDGISTHITQNELTTIAGLGKPGISVLVKCRDNKQAESLASVSWIDGRMDSISEFTDDKMSREVLAHCIEHCMGGNKLFNVLGRVGGDTNIVVLIPMPTI